MMETNPRGSDLVNSSSPLIDHNYASNKPEERIITQQSTAADETGNDSWQVVTKRRPYDASSTNSQKRSKHENPTLNNVKLQNSFAVLSGHNSNDDMEADISTAQHSEPKPPPIFIPDVGNVQAMIQTFKSVITTDDFSYKCVNHNSVKILPKSADIYRILVRKLNEGNVSFHTYQLKQDRAYRVVLKQMHYSVDKNDLKDALSQLGHNVRNVTNVLHSSTKQPLSMFFIDLEPSSNNKDIFNIQYLLHAKIMFEPPYKKKDIVQCKRCQQYGHTKTYCRHPFRCVKCGKEHDTTKCTKENSTPAVCALCGGDHPANYKGCTVFKNIQRRIYPPLREKSSMSIDTAQTPSVSKPRFIQPGKSFAEAVNTADQPTTSTRPTNNIDLSDNSSTNIITNDNLTNNITKFFDRFEKLFMQQSQQIGALLDLLTTVLKKLN